MKDYYTVLLIFGILAGGYFISKVVSRFLLKFMRKESSIESKETLQTISEWVIITLAVVGSIFYLGETTGKDFFLSFFEVLPQILLAVLLLTVGSIAINLIMWFLKSFLYYTHVEEILPGEIRQAAMPVILIVIRVVLYIILIEIILGLINLPALQTMLNFILYPIILLLFVFFA